MKILEVCRSMPWHLAGGMERHAWDLVRGLSARGDETHVLTTAPRPDRPVPPEPDGVAIHSLSRGPAGAYSLGVFRALAREAERLDREIGFDVIHAQGFAAYAFPKRLADRLAVTIHGHLTSETPLYGPVFRRLGTAAKAVALWRHKGRLASAPLFERMLRMARVVVVDSRFTWRELAARRPWIEPKLRLAPLGIHPERAPAEPGRPRGLPADPPRVLSVGRLTAAKGMLVALEALALIRDVPWRWRVAGTGPELGPLRREVLRLRMADRVEFLGEVDDARLARLYAQSDLFLYPELGYPAFGLVALEALLAGLPVVASDRGAIPEVVRPDCGWLVEADNPKALAERLADLAAHPVQIVERASGCRELALGRFSFDQMIEKTRSALAECTASGAKSTD